jgi:class 3 adenylate cyclase
VRSLDYRWQKILLRFLRSFFKNFDSGSVAAILFTDIVGATEKAVALGDRRWHDLLDSHHSLVRRELTRFRGDEIDTAGDGFFAHFERRAEGLAEFGIACGRLGEGERLGGRLAIRAADQAFGMPDKAVSSHS